MLVKLTPPDDAPLPWRVVPDTENPFAYARIWDANDDEICSNDYPPAAKYMVDAANAVPELEEAIEQWAADYATATEEAVRIHSVMHARIAALEQENATISGLRCRIRRLEDLLVEAASIVREMAPGNTVLLDDIDKETP